MLAGECDLSVKIITQKKAIGTSDQIRYVRIRDNVADNRLDLCYIFHLLFLSIHFLLLSIIFFLF